MSDDFNKKRSVYRHAELERVLNPKSIAIVGASSKVGSFGDRVLANLAAFSGDIFLVNSKYERLGERPCLTIASAAYFTARKVPIRLTLSTSRQRSTVSSKNGTKPPLMPAFA